MPRIRTVKPEFWSSPGIETISPWARLLYIAMWNWADDSGRGTCQLRELQAFAFPLDEDGPAATMAGFRRVLAEVRDQFGVVFYKVGGRPYYAIPSWRKHQRNERTAQSRHPAPDEGVTWNFLPPTPPDQGGGGTSDDLRHGAAEGFEGPAGGATEAPEPPGGAEDHHPDESQVISLFGDQETGHDQGGGGPSDDLRHGAAEPPQTSGPGTGEQGNRGTNTSASASRLRAPAAGSDDDPHWCAFWDTYPLKRDKKQARKAFAAAVKTTPPETIIEGARRYAEEVRRLQLPDSKIKYAQGWLNGDRWNDQPISGRPALPAATSSRTEWMADRA